MKEKIEKFSKTLKKITEIEDAIQIIVSFALKCPTRGCLLGQLCRWEVGKKKKEIFSPKAKL